MSIAVPDYLKQRCGNCRFRAVAEAADRKAFYSLCHRAPPVMIVENYESGLLKTWFPIVVETMWCADFRFGGWQRHAINAAKFAVGVSIGTAAAIVARHIAWADIAAAIWIP